MVGTNSECRCDVALAPIMTNTTGRSFRPAFLDRDRDYERPNEHGPSPHSPLRVHPVSRFSPRRCIPPVRRPPRARRRALRLRPRLDHQDQPARRHDRVQLFTQGTAHMAPHGDRRRGAASQARWRGQDPRRRPGGRLPQGPVRKHDLAPSHPRLQPLHHFPAHLLSARCPALLRPHLHVREWPQTARRYAWGHSHRSGQPNQ